MEAKRGRLSKEEVKFILDNISLASIEAMAAKLNRRVCTVEEVIRANAKVIVEGGECRSASEED